MNIIRHIIRFFLIVLAQSFLLNQIEVGLGIQWMIYPLFIFLLPIKTPIFWLLFLSFLLGISIDIFSNTFGLHASSAVFIAAVRNYWYQLIESKEDLEEMEELSISQLGFFKIAILQGFLILLHHLWFFSFEMFKWTEFLFIIQKTLLSMPCSLALIVIIQKIFFKKVH
ncbi:MAG: rod shape-determining protein MreD [Flavobacteriia bacterium]|nr:rod shape-determining protein MreD [Flavobacteriia bacterium]